MRTSLAVTVATALVLLSGAGVAAAQEADDQGDLRKLRTLKLAHEDEGASGTLTFDGRALYYAPQAGTATSVVHRMSPIDGRALEDVEIDVPALDALTYDARRHRLYAVGSTYTPSSGGLLIGGGTTGFAMYDVDPTTGDSELMFDLPEYGLTHYSFDSILDRFRVLSEGSETLRTVTLDGTEERTCEVQGLGTSNTGRGPSTLAAAGSGEVYVQLEDDATIVRVSKTCDIVVEGQHAKYSEAAENDAMVCDTVTFGVPAVWIRDGQLNAVSAYEVPSGYCPLPTALAPVRASSGTVSRGQPTTLCTRLSLPGHQLNLPGQLVSMSVDATVIGVGRTDRNGVLCLPHTPQQSGQHRLAAAFRGTLAYLPSHAVGLLSVQAAAPGAPPPRAAAPREEPATAGRPAPQPAPQPNAQPALPAPAPAAQTAGQAQAQAQAQVQAQAQQQVQVVAVPQVQEQLELAWVDERGDLAIRRFRPRQRRHDVPLPHALVVFALAGACCKIFGRVVAKNAKAE